MANPAPKDGHWKDLGDSDLKAAIEEHFRKNPPPRAGKYYALIVDVENPISGYHVVQNPA